MKLLETTKKPGRNYFSSVRRVITTSVSSLLTWIKMFLNVGFVIIAVVILGDVLGRPENLVKPDPRSARHGPVFTGQKDRHAGTVAIAVNMRVETEIDDDVADLLRRIDRPARGIDLQPADGFI